jgi:type 1 glutamine amidotransferase
VSEQDGKTYPVAWINQYGKARVFGTTFGHSDDTFRDPVFLTLVSRGVLWAADRLAD